LVLVFRLGVVLFSMNIGQFVVVELFSETGL